MTDLTRRNKSLNGGFPSKVLMIGLQNKILKINQIYLTMTIPKFKCSDITSIKMSTNPPKAIVDAGFRVIHDGKVKHYVGIGWVVESNATNDDYSKYPEII